MKTKLLLIALCTFYAGYSQVPTNYYDSATGSGYTLKTQLKNIIDSDNDGLTPEFQSTDPGYSALYTTYLTSDSDSYYENNGTVLDMYSENPTGTDSYEYTHFTDQDPGSGGTSEGQFYNREHIIPQSVFNQVTPQRSDAHFVVPSDKFVNGARGSFPFGRVQTANLTTTNGSKRGNNLDAGYSAGYTATVFEPIDEFKGDIARMHFYFATRYEDNVSGYTYTMFNGTSNQVFDQTFLNILIAWHNQDPVSAREIDRNNAIFAIQNNRNPFIDHPEYVGMIWTSTTDTEPPTTPTNLMVSNETSNSIDLSWTASTDNTAVTAYDVYVNSVFNKSVATTTTTVNGLSAETTYSFTVLAKDAAGNESAQSNSANGTTLAGGTGGSDCATETFANIGAASSSYETRMWTGDDGGNWTATDARTDQTLTGSAITIRNGELTGPSISGGIGSLTVTTIRVFGGGNGTFTVRVNGTSVGTIPYSDVQQTATISDINITGNIAVSFTDKVTTGDRVIIDDLSWTCYDPALGVDDFDLDDLVAIYPNPSFDGSITVNIPNGNDNELNIYDITGKRIIAKQNIEETTQLSNLPKGILLLEIISSQRSITKKVVIQ
ncbi:endonuclease [Aquimarina sp. 2201CG14-23]|uniref:endonuclease n=1 Tax=Aquimarina mycalae TaxID=3040073 RepID=UPI002477CD2A|nr:endonuclease [Aquimarina sp. 2201CG14-23]MDH7447203.1 endonuclease [Aquimarina sp. 2201CG14-23]